MEDNAITGMLTEELFELDWLEELYLASNSMTGTVPEAIGEGAVLKVLDLTGNGFKGSIPEFSDRTSIQRLYLGLNKLKGTIPDSLALAPDLDVAPSPPDVLDWHDSRLIPKWIAPCHRVARK